MSSSQGQVSGVVAVWPQDDDCDCRTESGDRLSGRGHGGDGEVLLEVREEGGEERRGDRGFATVGNARKCCLYLLMRLIQESHPVTLDGNFKIRLKVLL